MLKNEPGPETRLGRGGAKDIQEKRLATKDGSRRGEA
jgi:hypothetical protein